MAIQPSQRVETPSQTNQARVVQLPEPSLINRIIASGGHFRRQVVQNTADMEAETQ